MKAEPRNQLRHGLRRHRRWPRANRLGLESLERRGMLSATIGSLADAIPGDRDVPVESELLIEAGSIPEIDDEALPPEVRPFICLGVDEFYRMPFNCFPPDFEWPVFEWTDETDFSGNWLGNEDVPWDPAAPTDDSGTIDGEPFVIEYGGPDPLWCPAPTPVDEVDGDGWETEEWTTEDSTGNEVIPWDSALPPDDSGTIDFEPVVIWCFGPAPRWWPYTTPVVEVDSDGWETEVWTTYGFDESVPQGGEDDISPRERAMFAAFLSDESPAAAPQVSTGKPAAPHNGDFGAAAAWFGSLSGVTSDGASLLGGKRRTR